VIPDISIIIPVIDETQTIQNTLAHLARPWAGGIIEVIVIDGDPDAKTLKAIDVKKVSSIRLKTDTSPRGRGTQMNQGAKLASGSILLFLHADTRLPEGAFDAMATTMHNRHIIGGAFDLGIRSKRWGYRVIENVAAARSRITRLPYGDQAIFLRKEYFHMMGGFSAIPIMEDVDLMQRIKKRGDRIDIIPKRVQTDPRRWEKEGMVFGTLRNWTLILLYLLGVSPDKLVRYYQ
jgi:rSAM/selenodomain-associated transferase 2